MISADDPLHTLHRKEIPFVDIIALYGILRVFKRKPFRDPETDLKERKRHPLPVFDDLRQLAGFEGTDMRTGKQNAH